jgi:hypothetical protein
LKVCFQCKTEWLDRETPGFSAMCEKCGSYLHCCRNCRFYSPGMNNDCRETQAEPVRDKEKFNRCEWFQFSEGDNAGEAEKRAAAARARLEALFGPPGTQDAADAENEK